MSDVAVSDLKGGHAPAQKVGGMRVVTRPRVSESEKPVEKTKEEGEEESVEEAEKEDKKKVVVSGATTGEEEAFPKVRPIEVVDNERSALNMARKP